VKDSLCAFAPLVAGLQPQAKAMRARRWKATPLPPTSPITWCARACRSAMRNEAVARAVRAAEKTGCDLASLPLKTLQRFSEQDRQGLSSNP